MDNSKNKIIQIHLDWIETRKKYEDFHNKFIRNRGKVGYYLKSWQTSLKWNAINENLRYCKENIDGWFDTILEIEKTVNWHWINQKNFLVQYMNNYYMLYSTLKEILKIYKTLFILDNEFITAIESSFKTMNNIVFLRKVLIHPIDINIEKKNIDSIYDEQPQIISLYRNGIELNRKAIDSVWNKIEYEYNKAKIKTKRGIKFYLQENYSNFTKDNLVDRFFGGDRPQIELLTRFSGKNQSIWLKFNEHDILFKSIKKLNDFLEIFNQYKFNKISQNLKKDIVVVKRNKMADKKTDFISIDYKKINIAKSLNKLFHLKIYLKITGTKKVKKEWILEYFYDDKWHKKNKYGFHWTHKGASLGTLLNDYVGETKEITFFNLFMNEHFHYNMNQPDALLIQIFLTAFKIDWNEFYTNYLGFEWKQSVGSSNPLKFVFGFCKVIDFSKKSLEEINHNLIIIKKESL